MCVYKSCLVLVYGNVKSNKWWKELTYLHGILGVIWYTFVIPQNGTFQETVQVIWNSNLFQSMCLPDRSYQPWRSHSNLHSNIWHILLGMLASRHIQLHKYCSLSRCQGTYSDNSNQRTTWAEIHVQTEWLWICETGVQLGRGKYFIYVINSTVK